MIAHTLIPRSCTEITTDGSTRTGYMGSQPLSAFRDVPAYVLLGEPGSGKTTEFQQERMVLGDAAEFISARRFAKADIAAHPEWRDKVLFIDGLDETRSDTHRNTTALDEIQSRLDALGNPSFRISCRVADWLGSVDRKPLTDVSPNDSVASLILDPLDRSAVHKYLKSKHDVEDPAAFIGEIRASGMEFMLGNPQLLGLVVKSASGADGLPSSRQEVFEFACRELVTEHNPNHPRSTLTCSPDALLEAAMRLCAIQLLANKDGYRLSSVPGDPNFIGINEITSDADDTSDGVVSTNLFRGAAEQHIAPVHRQVAEYLGARYLADLVDSGTVSAGRICAALLSPVGGRVVTDLRGLVAWLGTLSASARSLLIAADPVGMALYGDISEWPVGDRRKLLDCLVDQTQPRDFWGSTWFDSTEHRYRDAVAWSFRGLCKPDMTSSVAELLDKSATGDHASHITELALRSLAEAEAIWLEELRCLLPKVESLMFDTALDPEVRRAAIDAFNRIAPTDEKAEQTLLEVLDSVGSLDADDSDRELTGTLLRLLYPKVVSPRNVWQYSFEGPGIPIGGRYWRFWNDVLAEGSDVDELRELLDAFARESSRDPADSGPRSLDDVPWRMLERLTSESESLLPVADLYRWLCSVTGDLRNFGYQSQQNKQSMQQWLGDNPDAHLELLAHHIILGARGDLDSSERFAVEILLFAPLPADFAEWCAQNALARTVTDPKSAWEFVTAPLRIPWIMNREVSIQQLRSALATDPQLLSRLDEWLAPSAVQLEFQEEELRYQREIDEIRAERGREKQERQTGWRDLLRQSHDELAANRFSAQNLHTLASAYFGRLRETPIDATPVERVAELIGDDAELLDAVVDALRNAPVRADVPSAERTAELSSKSKYDWLAYPVLAGLDIRETEGTLDSWHPPDDLRRSAVAIYATVLLNQQHQPSWPVKWLHEDPPLVLDVLHRCSVAAIANGETHMWMLNWLDNVDGLGEDLRDFRLRLLKSISVRLPLAQLQIMDRLVHLVSKHPDATALKALVAKKLAAKSMTDAQRVRWMTLDAVMNGGEALRLLDDFIGSNSKRARQLAEFLPRGFENAAKFVDRLLGDKPCAVLRTLVDVIGRNFPQRDLKSGEIVSYGPAEEMSDLVSQWINDLAGQPTPQAADALDALIADERLSAWHSCLEFARNRQRRLQSDTSYSPMDVADVISLLDNGPPYNAADLRVLLCDHLRDLNTHISGDNSDPWRQFWADDQKAPPEQPKHEDSCRDALLTMLRSQLPEGVDAQPEGQYAADRRTDIRVGVKGFNIPIEIKKNTHPDLWTAIEDQLIVNYTSDPATDGHGVYVVLWFGSGIPKYPRHPDSHDRPGTPSELERRLIESLSHEQRRKISVVVLDATKP
ncbi:MAG: hypothetical protein OXF75_00070 [Acidimicrobiaceae bacterium]|nr:hypothetical protein [Acidimicrobiaceae bacterium]